MFLIQQDWINATIGGILIGISASLMLLWNGRVTGISGIVNGTLNPTKGEFAWRALFILGLFFGGFVLKFIHPLVFTSSLVAPKMINLAKTDYTSAGPSIAITIAAGLLVGFGTVMGSGCTSGHGICGITRRSPRSIVATLCFIAAGALAVYTFKKMGLI